MGRFTDANKSGRSIRMRKLRVVELYAGTARSIEPFRSWRREQLKQARDSHLNRPNLGCAQMKPGPSPSPDESRGSAQTGHNSVGLLGGVGIVVIRLKFGFHLKNSGPTRR